VHGIGRFRLAMLRTANTDAALQQQQGDRSDELLEKYRAIITRLRLDIRFFIHSLAEFAEPPETDEWEPLAAEAERQLQEFAAVAMKERLPSVAAIVSMLNLRDSLLMAMIDSTLYWQAVLYLELRRGTPPEGMARLQEQVQIMATKMDKLPELYVLPNFPKVTDCGPYTYDKSQHALGNDVVSKPSTLPGRCRTLFMEMHSMEKHLRRMKFGASVKWMPEAHVKSEDLRKEITVLFDKFSKLDHELQTSKAQRHTPWEQRIEQLTAKIQEKEQIHSQLLQKEHKLENELIGLRADHNNVQKELQELKERNQKVTNENLPRLEKIKVLLKETWSEVDSLTADAAMLSAMFRQQVVEYESAVMARDAVSSELSKVQTELREKNTKTMYKEKELQKKETLYQRTVDARHDILKSYQQKKVEIKEVEERHEIQNEVWQKLRDEAEERDERIQDLRLQINTSNKKIDLLEQQKRLYMEEFRKKVGKPCGMLLEQLKRNTNDAK